MSRLYSWPQRQALSGAPLLPMEPSNWTPSLLLHPLPSAAHQGGRTPRAPLSACWPAAHTGRAASIEEGRLPQAHRANVAELRWCLPLMWTSVGGCLPRSACLHWPSSSSSSHSCPFLLPPITLSLHRGLAESAGTFDLDRLGI